MLGRSNRLLACHFFFVQPNHCDIEGEAQQQTSVQCPAEHVYCYECILQQVSSAVSDPNNQHALDENGNLKCAQCQGPLNSVAVIRIVQDTDLLTRYLEVRSDIARRQV